MGLALEHVYTLRNTYAIAAANLSIGGGRFTTPCPNSPLSDVANRLRSAGIATVIAAGNDGYTDALGFPACTPNAISVGATTKADAVASFYNSASFLTLWAPGVDILSSVPFSTTPGGFTFVSGTSMAAPHVAGAWAVIKSKSPAASVDEALSAIQSTGRPITDPRNGITKRRIQLDAALSALPPPGVPSSISVPTEASGTNSATWSISWGPASGSVVQYELQRDTSSDFSWAYIVYSGPNLSWTENGGGTFYYRVRACGNTGCGSYRAGANPVVATVYWTGPVLLPPPAPTSVSISVPPSSNSGIYSISWSASGATDYLIQESTDPSFPGTPGTKQQRFLYQGAALSLTLMGKSNGVYYYRVWACNRNKDYSSCSGPVNGANGVSVQ